MQLTEGKITFNLGNAFYRSHSKRSRDLGVLAAAVYKKQIGQLKVLDTMTGCGIRVLRYAIEARADRIWANDGDPDIHQVLKKNLAVLDPNYVENYVQITHDNVNRVFWQCAIDRDYYDLIDIDSFGNPAEFMASCLQAVCHGGLIYLTSTDGRAISGHFPQDSLRLYGAYTRSTPSVQEHALRILIGSLAQQGAMQGLTVKPVFSVYAGPLYRVMVRVTKTVPNLEKHHGFVAYCPSCGDYQLPTWRHLSRAHCKYHQRPLNMALVGPLWTGPLHDRLFLAQMIAIAPDLDLSRQIPFLDLLHTESDLPPYHFPLGEIGRRGKLDIPKRDRLILALNNQGFVACETHLSHAAIKTNASIAQIVTTARTLLL
jgi:tRNA (guanine26-N2/guanine27-N2)-dimethyltransferase